MLHMQNGIPRLRLRLPHSSCLAAPCRALSGHSLRLPSLTQSTALLSRNAEPGQAAFLSNSQSLFCEMLETKGYRFFSLILAHEAAALRRFHGKGALFARYQLEWVCSGGKKCATRSFAPFLSFH